MPRRLSRTKRLLMPSARQGFLLGRPMDEAALARHLDVSRATAPRSTAIIV